MQTKRKGARWLGVGDQRWSYYVGKRFVEIRSPDNKATLVSREVMDEDVVLYCSCGPEYNCYGKVGEYTLPGRVACYIKANLL